MVSSPLICFFLAFEESCEALEGGSDAGGSALVAFDVDGRRSGSFPSARAESLVVRGCVVARRVGSLTSVAFERDDLVVRGGEGTAGEVKMAGCGVQTRTSQRFDLQEISSTILAWIDIHLLVSCFGGSSPQLPLGCLRCVVDQADNSENSAGDDSQKRYSRE